MMLPAPYEKMAHEDVLRLVEAFHDDIPSTARVTVMLCLRSTQGSNQMRETSRKCERDKRRGLKEGCPWWFRTQSGYTVHQYGKKAYTINGITKLGDSPIVTATQICDALNEVYLLTGAKHG